MIDHKIYKVDMQRVEGVEDVLASESAFSVIEEQRDNGGQCPGLPCKGKGGSETGKDLAAV